MRAAGWRRSLASAAALAIVVGGCASGGSAPSGRSESPAPASSASAPASRELNAQEVERLKRIMVPLVRAMNNPKPLDRIKVGIMADPHVNAANAGGGQFYVTTGLLQKANDRQLAGVLAHEVAHDDLGHVAKAQALATGLGIGMVILDQVLPGSGAVTPIAGQLVARSYGRREEYAADKHAMTILSRAGDTDSRGTMVETLNWLIRTEGGSKGGFFATHPATDDRVEALLKP